MLYIADDYLQTSLSLQNNQFASAVLALYVFCSTLAHTDTGRSIRLVKFDRPVVPVARHVLPEEAHVLALYAEGLAEVAEDAVQRLVGLDGDWSRLELPGVPQQHALWPGVVAGSTRSVRRGHAQSLALATR